MVIHSHPTCSICKEHELIDPACIDVIGPSEDWPGGIAVIDQAHSHLREIFRRLEGDPFMAEVESFTAGFMFAYDKAVEALAMDINGASQCPMAYLLLLTYVIGHEGAQWAKDRP